MLPTKSVFFVENTEEGELMSRMKELMRRLTPSLGFKIKIVERSGSSLRSKFPLSTLWEGTKCGRQDCTTCNQGGEKLPPCTRTSVLYENVCSKCSKELEDVKEGSIYIEESSRTIYERSKEHWKDWQSRSEKSHVLGHQVETHGGDEQPEFCMRTVRFFRSALSRQVGEAVRIMRRGGAGAILNSKSKFDRCRIPRLVLDDKEDSEEEVRRKEEQRLLKDKEAVEEQAEIWSTTRYNERRKDDLRAWAGEPKTTGSRKTKKEVKDGSRRAKKMKYSIMGENWGEEEQVTEESPNTINSVSPPTPPPPPPPNHS